MNLPKNVEARNFIDSCKSLPPGTSKKMDSPVQRLLKQDVASTYHTAIPKQRRPHAPNLAHRHALDVLVSHTHTHTHT